MAASRVSSDTEKMEEHVEEEALLASSKSEHINFLKSRPHSLTCSTRPFIWSLFINCMLTILILVAILKSSRSKDPSQAHFSPAQEAIQYETRVFTKGFGNDRSPYQGWPNDEIDELWEELYWKGVSLHVDENAHSQLPNKSEHVPVPGLESEYLVGLDVFHQLHCLNTIRKSFYPRRYNITLASSDGTVDYLAWLHIDHCIESIRQSLTCHADISTMFYHWLPGKYMMPQLGVTHTCRNFDMIRDWAWDHWADWNNKRSVVENGRVVDYTGWGKDPEQDLDIPKDWTHKSEEFVS